MFRYHLNPIAGSCQPPAASADWQQLQLPTVGRRLRKVRAAAAAALTVLSATAVMAPAAGAVTNPVLGVDYNPSVRCSTNTNWVDASTDWYAAYTTPRQVRINPNGYEAFQRGYVWTNVTTGKVVYSYWGPIGATMAPVGSTVTISLPDTDPPVELAKGTYKVVVWYKWYYWASQTWQSITRGVNVNGYTYTNDGGGGLVYPFCYAGTLGPTIDLAGWSIR
ncbi:MAG: hypothetical protein M3Q31_05495 [Actinomycetota bacterium]|nr:hypothetical protein [Actinomycetota bacterium]